MSRKRKSTEVEEPRPAPTPRGTTTVCNVKVRHLRPQDQNLKEWMERTDSNVYIGRAGVVFVNGVRFPSKNSEWANPFKIGKHGNRDAVLRQYREHIEAKLRSDETLKEKLTALKGKCLGCWCVDTPVSVSSDAEIVCHGQILLQLIEKILGSATVEQEQTESGVGGELL